MDIRIETATTSIASCLDTVKGLRAGGVAKENIYIITNASSREIIHNNYDLRQKDGSVFSAHSLIQNINTILTLPEIVKSGPIPEALVPYTERIEFGSMVVAVSKVDNSVFL